MDDLIIGLKKCAVLCVIRNKNKILLLKRNKEPHKDEYIPIGGKIEPYESPFDAVKREIYEEIGIILQEIKFMGVLVETSQTKYNWVNFIYVSDIDYFEPTECNEGTLQWIDMKDILNIPTPPSDIYIYEYIRDNKSFMFNAVYNNEIELLALNDEIGCKNLYTKK